MKRILILFLVSCFLVSCSKDEIIDKYNDVLQSIDVGLSSDKELQGKRVFGDDNYTGTYKAEYNNFSDSETLFGSTALERNNGNELKIDCKLSIQSGVAKVLLKAGSNEAQTLYESSGDYTDKINLQSGSNYISVEGENFTGSIELEIK